MSEEATVLTDEADGVLVITINRPEAKNAVNLSVAQGVAAALERLDSDDSLRVGVLTGAGGTFCAGMDLKAFVTGEFPQIEGRGFGGMTERSADKPLIAAVEGYALAGGCELAITCDLIVAQISPGSCWAPLPVINEAMRSRRSWFRPFALSRTASLVWHFYMRWRWVWVF